MIIDKIPAAMGSDGSFRIDKIKADVSVNELSVAGSSPNKKMDTIEFNSKSLTFSDELSQRIRDIKADVKKQASIDRKKDISDQVKANQYVVDVKALALKLKQDDFDKKI